MSSMIESQKAHELGPTQGKIAAIQTTTSSVEFNLETHLGENPVGKFILLNCSQTTYFAFAPATGGAAINESTYTVGSDARCACMSAGTWYRVFCTGKFIHLKAAAGGWCRAWISSS